VKQQAVGQRLCCHRIGAVKKHDRFAEALARANHFDDFLFALDGLHREFDLAESHDIKPPGGVARTKYQIPFFEVARMNA